MGEGGKCCRKCCLRSANQGPQTETLHQRHAVKAAAAFPLYPVCLTREAVEEKVDLVIYFLNGSALVY